MENLSSFVNLEDIENETVVEPETEKNLISLIALGRLEEDFKVFGHNIRLKTLTLKESLQLAEKLAPYENKGLIAMNIAQKAYTIAQAIISIDGEHIYTPLKKDEDILEKKAQYILENFYVPVINKIFKCYTQLVEKQQKVVDSLENF